jgi:putative ABC transport system substrate-binding protein
MRVDVGWLQTRSQGKPMSRRAFGRTLLGLLVVAPRTATAQGQTVMRRIGILEASAPDTPEEMWKQAAPLRELGWVEGQNLRVERRYANGRLEALQPLAEELVRGKVEIIVANGPNPTLAAKRATSTIPIVFRIASDPVISGLVASLARPGGNVTGFSASTPEVIAKLLSLLKELLPTLQRIGMLEVSGNPQFRLLRGGLEHTCRSAGVEPVYVEIAVASEIDGAIAQMARQRVQALVLLTDSFTTENRFEIINAALKRSLPTMTVGSDFARAGALATYSVTDAEVDRRSASYVDRILRGARPADLPVEQPTQFELVINLKTARALGLTIPQSMLLRADEVIQ